MANSVKSDPMHLSRNTYPVATYNHRPNTAVGKIRVIPKAKPPKGFDISLDDIIEKFLISKKDIDRLIEINKCHGDIAVCRVGNNFYYRESQIEKLFRRR